MSSPDIRLRLVIRRHGVPDVRLVWPCSASDDLTIAKLLLQINEAITLESGEWGFEDYAVELADGKGGTTYECLHFQQVRQILKDDDQLLIRSLLGEDLKRRRLSGRHQISTDGKHLVDGLAFGRPWLRTPRDRPQFLLPPRKRGRITYDNAQEEEEDDDGEPLGQLLLEGPGSLDQGDTSVSLEAVFDDADHYEDDEGGDEYDEDDEDDADFSLEQQVDETSAENHLDDGDESSSSDDEQEEDLNEELQMLRRDNDSIGHDLALEKLEFDNGVASDEEIPDAFDLDLDALDNIRALRQAFPFAPLPTIEKELRKQRSDLRRAFDVLSASNSPSISFDELLDKIFTGLIDPSVDLAGDGQQATRNPTRPLIEVVESDEVPVSNGISANKAAKAHTTRTKKVSRADSSDDHSSSSSDEDSDSTSEEEDDDGSSSDSGAKLDDDDTSDNTSPTSSSGSSDASDSSSDSGEDVIDALDDRQQQDAVSEVSSNGSSGSDSSDEDSSDSSDDSDSDPEPEETTSKPGRGSVFPLPQTNTHEVAVATKPPGTAGAGLSKTKKRNARRRKANLMKRLGGEGIGDRNTAEEASQDDLAARKEALLGALLRSPDQGSPNASQNEPGVDANERSAQDEATPIEEKLDTPQQTSASKDDGAQRRSRVDLGAGRRLLFGALGLKAPKSKNDEEKIRQGLMKDVRPLQNLRTVDAQDGAVNKPLIIEVDDDLDLWKEKITYRGVECCHDGIVLSEPPFPFVQRWDHQQKYDSMRKRKRTSNQFAEVGSMDEEDRPTKKSRKKKKKSMARYDDYEQAHNDDIDESQLVLNYDDVVPDTLGEGGDTSDVGDLPALPSDCSALPPLTFGAVKAGMVVTWKQLVLSKATQWQPQIIPMTALVVSGGNEATLNVVLAKRDREAKERVYDEETGQRVYGKFEAPDSDDDDEAEDDGYREVSWSDIIDPRLVQEAPDGTSFGDSFNIEVSQTYKPSGLRVDELDTQEMRDAVGDDSTSRERNPPGSNESASIPSGQVVLHLDPLSPGEDVLPLGSTIGALSTNGDICSDSGQPSLERASRLESGVSSHQLGRLSRSNQTNEDIVADQPAGLDLASADTAPTPEVKSAPERATVSGSLADLSQRVPSLDGTFSSLVNHEISGTAAQHPNQTIPSSLDSVHSGRQPQPNFGLDTSLSQLDEQDSVIPDSIDQPGETTPRAVKDLVENPASSSSSSSFPSVEEIFLTARQTQSQKNKSVQSDTMASITPKKLRGLDYEAAMRKLDNGDESAGTPDGDASARVLFPNLSQPAMLAEIPEVPKRATRKSSRAARGRRSSASTVPKGSRVITLSSSPNPSSSFDRHAEDGDGGMEESNRKPTAVDTANENETAGDAKASRNKVRKVSTATPLRATARVTRSQPPSSESSAAPGFKTSTTTRRKGKRKGSLQL